MIGLIILAYLAIGYTVSVLITLTKFSFSVNSIPLIECKEDFLQCVVLWPIVILCVFITIFFRIVFKLLSKIPWPIYKDLD